jgi:hypothetical protein
MGQLALEVFIFQSLTFRIHFATLRSVGKMAECLVDH